MRLGWLLLLATLLAAGCSGRPTTTRPTPSETATAPVIAPAATTTPLPAVVESRSTPTVTPPTPTATPVFAVCSPLEGISVGEINQPDLLKNPFQPPRPGMDDGHHGIDLAYWSRGDRKTMVGLPIHSVLPGQVAAVVHNREPYGNMVIIETPLDALPAAWLQAMTIPAVQPTVTPATSLRCPPDQNAYASANRSLYLLYAHMNKTPIVALNQHVACGEPLGEVGTTGKSVNPHLHLEVRVGPSGARFDSMAHYDTSATDAEMSAYCTWRVSGLFEMFNPLSLFH